MTPNQLHPLEINPKTQEVFLRLRKHKNIVLTPMRWQDASHMVPLLNDVRVYDWLASQPHPYVLKNADDWLRIHKPRFDSWLQDLQDAQGSEYLIAAKGPPVCTIREVHEDGTDTYIGTIFVTRCSRGEIMNTDTVDFERADQNVADNNRLEAGDPNIVWSIGDFLAPSHHRQGIMTDAVDTLLHEWAIPRMKVMHVLTGAFIGNDGSVKVFERNGFKVIRTIEDYLLVRGRMRGLHVLEWKLAKGL